MLHWKDCRWTLRFGTGGITRSPGFEVNDMGYLRSADQTIVFIHGGYHEFKPGKNFWDYHFNSSACSVYNYGMDRIVTGANINLDFRFLNYWDLFGGFEKESEIFDTDFLWGGPGVIVPGRYRYWFGGHSDQLKRISVFLHGNYSNDFYGSRSYQVAQEITFRPSGRITNRIL